MEEIEKANIDAALQKALELGALEQKPFDLPNGTKGILIPEGFSLEQVEPIDPERSKIVKGDVVLYDVESFIGYVKAFKTPSTHIFAAPGYAPSTGGQAYFKAILDYHGDAETPGTVRHTAHFHPPYAEEWKTWVLSKRVNIAQADFAEFIEENRKDIRAPNAATLLEMVRKFKVTKTQSFNSVAYQPDGSQAMTWEDKVKNEVGSIPVPEELDLGIPVYFEGGAYPLTVFMRYRVTEGKAYFTLKPDRADYVERAAFMEVRKKIETDTGITVLLGR